MHIFEGITVQSINRSNHIIQTTMFIKQIGQTNTLKPKKDSQ